MTNISTEAQTARENARVAGKFGEQIGTHAPEHALVDANPGEAWVSEQFPWADEAAMELILNDTYTGPRARLGEKEGVDEDGFPTSHCRSCGEELVSNFDGVRGLWGHAATDEVLCDTPERAAWSAHGFHTSIGKAMHPNEADRFREHARTQTEKANRLHAERSADK